MFHSHGTGIVHKKTTHLLSRVGGDAPLHLGRASSSDCVSLRCSSCPPYQNQKITAPSSQTFVARIGPSGDERGYMAITGEATPFITSSYQTYTTHTYTRTLTPSYVCPQVELGGVLPGTSMILSFLSWWCSEARPIPS